MCCLLNIIIHLLNKMRVTVTFCEAGEGGSQQKAPGGGALTGMSRGAYGGLVALLQVHDGGFHPALGLELFQQALDVYLDGTFRDVEH